MKKTLVIPGRRSIAKYSEIIQDGTGEILGVLANVYGNYTILAGCSLYLEPYTNTLNVEAGWVVFNQEVVKVPTHNIDVSSNVGGYLAELIASIENIEVNSTLTDKDGVIRPVSIEKILKFKLHDGEASPVYFTQFKKLKTAINTILQPEWFSEPLELTAGSGFTVAAGVANGSVGLGLAPVKIVRRLDGKLSIIGGMVANGGAAATINGVDDMKLLLTLDVAYRPEFNICFTTYTSGTAQDLVLFTDGKLCLNQATTAFNPEILLRSIIN
jgi:hypothetical protein